MSENSAPKNPSSMGSGGGSGGTSAAQRSGAAGQTSRSPSADASRSRSELSTSRGTTTIADAVVAKVAGIAAGEVSGVYALGGGAARAISVLRERIPGASTNHSQGVSVEVGETQAAVDVDIVAEYGTRIADLAAAIRRNVIESVETMTGLEVTEVNVTVNDVHVPDDDDDSTEDAAPSRVH